MSNDDTARSSHSADDSGRDAAGREKAVAAAAAEVQAAVDAGQQDESADGAAAFRSHPDDPPGWAQRGRLPDAPAAPGWLEPLVGAVSDDSVHSRLPERRPPEDRGPNMVGRVHRYASVLVLLSGDPDADTGAPPADATVLLTHRAPTMNSHSGQVSFPGGGVETGDTGPVDTALREAEEETGLDRDEVDVLAVMPDLYIPVSNYSVASVLGYWRVPGHVDVVDPGETARVMQVPLEQLLDPVNRFVLRHSSGWKGPAWHLDDLVLWGFTAGILSALISAAGWEIPWDTSDVRDLEEVIAASANGERNVELQRADREKIERAFAMPGDGDDIDGRGGAAEGADAADDTTRDEGENDIPLDLPADDPRRGYR